jgi:hypothetical protein
VLVVALVIVLDVVVAGVATVINGDMAVATGSLGCERRGWAVGWSAESWFGSEFHHTRVAGARFEAGREVVVVVVDVIGIIDGADGGCASIVSGDVAADGDVEGLVGVVRDKLGGSVDILAFFHSCGGGNSSLSAICITASMVELEVVWVLDSVVMLVIVSICVPSFACVAISWVLVLVWGWDRC